VIFSLSASAQSTDLNFPTAVTTNEINGTIKARDIGDSRLTSYFYTFEGGQGDVFINAVTKNFNGDIDVFAAEGLRPLTKMVLYADGGETETGRLVYLRKPERLVLRVEGRSPNDDPATFHIKFAGSFIAAAAQKPLQDPTVAKQDTEQESGIRVNSVGTIIEVIPKPQPAKEKPGTGETVAAANNKAQNPDPSKKENNNLPAPATATAKSPGTKTPKRSVATPKPKKNIATSKTPSAKTPAKPVGVAKNDSTRPAKPGTANTPEIKTVFKKPSKARNETVAEKAASDKVKPVAPPVVKAPDPLASIRLVVQLKDGDVIERPMSEIRKFSVDKGILTVIANDGSIVKYSILDVAKVTIQ
jgi:hypothetical protein